MASIRLYIARDHLYFMAPDGEVRRLPAAAFGQGVESAALSEAAGWLRSKWPAHAAVDLLLATSQVRFVTSPWVEGTFTARAVRRQVEQACAAADVDLDAWELRTQWPTYGSPTLSVAYPRTLVSGATAALRVAGMRVRSSTATAAVVAARFGGRLPARSGLLCFVEDDGLVGVHMGNGVISEVESISRTGSGLDSVDVWCRRKRLEYPNEGELRWLQVAHCPPILQGWALTAENSGSDCPSTDLLKAVA